MNKKVDELLECFFCDSLGKTKPNEWEVAKECNRKMESILLMWNDGIVLICFLLHLKGTKHKQIIVRLSQHNGNIPNTHTFKMQSKWFGIYVVPVLPTLEFTAKLPNGFEFYCSNLLTCNHNHGCLFFCQFHTVHICFHAR